MVVVAVCVEVTLDVVGDGVTVTVWIVTMGLPRRTVSALM